MIASLRGIISEVSGESAILDVNGVGYELICSLNTLAELQTVSFESGAGAVAKPGSTASKAVTVFTYTHVREDILQLFGFSTKTEKEMFLALLKVNGIGPKMAIHILSGASVDSILVMIESEDVKALSKLPKVGKKTAEQMILTLKGKLVVAQEDSKKSSLTKKSLSVAHKEISSALVNLGFRPQDVEKVVGTMPKEIDLQEGVRQGLAALTQV